MTRIDFYVLDSEFGKDRFQFTCELADKLYHQGRRLYLYSRRRDLGNHLDWLLWSYRLDSFLPHERHPSADGQTASPILIGETSPPPDFTDVLVNLAPEIPDFFIQFERLVEIVDADPALREVSRDHHRQYRQQGCEVLTWKRVAGKWQRLET